MPNYIKVKTGSSSWSTATKAYVKKSTGWVQPIRIWMKLLSGWTRIWPVSGPFAETSPFIASTASGSTHLMPTSPIRVGTTYYGRNGTWDPNGWTISSYNYQWRRYDSQFAGDDSGQTNRSSGTFSSPSIGYAPTAADDKRYLSFYISPVTTDTLEMSEAESGDDDGRLFVIRRPPINIDATLSSDTKVGTQISYTSSWNLNSEYLPVNSRTLIVWYRNTSATLTGADPVKVNLGSVAGAYTYTPVDADINNYIIAKETTFNSGTDYADGYLTLANTTGPGTPVGVSAQAITSSVISGAVLAPTSLTATSTRGDGVFLEWNQVPGANYYEVYRQSTQGTGPINQSPSANFGQDNTITTNSFLDTTILPGETRYYRVRARSSAVASGSNCSNWFPAPASNAVSGFRVKPGAITSCTAYAFAANTINGYFTTGSNTNSVQYMLRGITIPVSTPLYSLSTISNYPYQVSLSVDPYFTERVWYMDTYSPSTTYYANTSVWLAGNQYQSKLISFSGSGTAPSASGSNTYWTRGSVVGITPSTPITWSASTSYTQGQVVYYGTGNTNASVYSYTAKDPGFSGQAPTNTTYWTKTTTITYNPGDYVIYNGTRYYVTQTTTGTYPNNGLYWQNGLGQWRLEVTPYFSTGAGDVVYSTSTRGVLLSHSAAGDPLNLSSGPTFTSIGTNSFTTNYTTGLNANYVHIDTYRTEDTTRPTGYPKIQSKSTTTAYTDTPTGSVIIPSKNYTVTVKPRYYYSLSPEIFYDGTPSTNYVDTLSLNYQITGSQKRVFLPSVFNSGTTIYVSTNGYINWGGSDPSGSIAIPSSGITISPLTGDLRQGAVSASTNTSTGGLWYYSDANNYYVTWWGNYLNDAAQVARYQVKFYWGQAYADIYIVNNSLTSITPSTTAVQNNANEYQNWSTVSDQASTLLPTASMNRVSTQDGVDDNRTAIVASAPALTWTITWDAAGGENGTQSTTQNRGLAHTAPSPGARDGFDFAYYRYAVSQTDPTYVVSGGTYTPTASVTFTGIWTTKTYSVSYNANLGTGAPSNQTKTHGVTLTLSSNTPTRATVGSTSYAFNGWNTAADGTGTNYSAGGPYTANAAVILYAKWTTSTVVSIPTNVTQPTLSGGLAVGTTLTFGVGSWSGSPTIYALRLYRGTAGVITSETLAKNAGNVTSSTYVITQADYDSGQRYFRAFATATNAAGTSNSGTFTPGQEVGPVTSSSSTPATAPGIPGTPTNGWVGGLTYPFSWTGASVGTVAGGGAATISSYQIKIYRAQDSVGTGSALYNTYTSTGSGTSYSFTAPDGLYYAASVSATNSAGLSSSSYSGISAYK